MNEEQAALVLQKDFDIKPEHTAAIAQIDGILEKYAPEKLAELPPMSRTVALAKGMLLLQKALSDDMVKTMLMPLAGSALGFLTDRDSKPANEKYGIEVIKVVACEAMLRGLRPVNNEFNVIAGKCYTTINGIERKVREFPGLTDLILTPEVPFLTQGKALVAYRASWKRNGHDDAVAFLAYKDGEQVVDQRIPVRVNAGMGDDAVLGKAKRKVLARIYEKLTGQSEPVGDAAEAGFIDVEGTSEPEPRVANTAEGLAAKHEAKAKPEAARPVREPGEEG